MKFMDIYSRILANQIETEEEVVSIAKINEILEQKHKKFFDTKDYLVKKLEDCGVGRYKVDYDTETKILKLTISYSCVIGSADVITFTKTDDDLIVVDSDYSDLQKLLENGGDIISKLYDLHSQNEDFLSSGIDNENSITCIEDPNITLCELSEYKTTVNLDGNYIEKKHYSDKYSYSEIKSKNELDFMNANIQTLFENLHVPLNLLPDYIKQAVRKEKESKSVEHSSKIKKLSLFKNIFSKKNNE